MTYIATDKSTQDGLPVELFKFTQGSESWFYTNADRDIDYNGDTYVAEYITRNRIMQTDDISKNGISLSVMRTNAVGSKYYQSAQLNPVSVTVFREHYSDGEFITYWKGRIGTAKSSGSKISLECESIFTGLRRSGLTGRDTKMCRHALYSSGHGMCNVSKAAFAVAVTVDAISGVAVTAAGASAYPDGWFVGGMLEDVNGNARFITHHAGDSLTLISALDTLTVADEVNAYPGCDRLFGTCNSKFNNTLHFGGAPWFPNRNPLGGSSIV